MHGLELQNAHYHKFGFAKSEICNRRQPGDRKTSEHKSKLIRKTEGSLRYAIKNQMSLN